jgi:hypothetical protein
MMLWISFARRPYTLHSWLLLAEWVLLPLSLAGLYVAISSWQKVRGPNRDLDTQPLKSDSTITSAAPGWNWSMLSTAWESWQLRLSARYQKLPFLNGLRDKRYPPKRGWAKYAPILFAFVFCAVWIAVAYHSKPRVEYLKDVQILERLNDYDFRYQIVDPDTREWNEFIWTGCHDYIPTREIQRGATLLWIKYVEDKTQSCQEVGWNNLGYKLWRDQNDHPVFTTVPR